LQRETKPDSKGKTWQDTIKITFLEENLELKMCYKIGRESVTIIWPREKHGQTKDREKGIRI
jgi:hypothetical protein